MRSKHTTILPVAGDRIARWTILSSIPAVDSHSRKRYLCRCDCGAESMVLLQNLRNGESKSCRACGRLRNPDPTRQLPEYQVWVVMRQRCENPNSQVWANYGGRGIKVCARWQSYDAFLADMGQRPSDAHSLDRIDVNGDYEPTNCRWATKAEQCRNKRDNRWIEFNGERLVLEDWATRLNISPSVIGQRIKLGWPLDKVLTPYSHRTRNAKGQYVKPY